MNLLQILPYHPDKHLMGKNSRIRRLEEEPSPELNLGIYRGRTEMENFSCSHLQTQSHPPSYVAIINAWIKFSAVRFCSDVPDIRAIRSPRDDLESEISIDAPDI